jgi:uncharacterized protein (UPF0333 family)
MKKNLTFLKIFKLREIIETILLIVIGYLLIDMFNVPTFLIEKYETSIITAESAAKTALRVNFLVVFINNT